MFLLRECVGELSVDQAHRGYTTTTDAEGHKSVNPLFMKYLPTNGEAQLTL